jgi:hypothetical protein
MGVFAAMDSFGDSTAFQLVHFFVQSKRWRSLRQTAAVKKALGNDFTSTFTHFHFCFFIVPGALDTVLLWYFCGAGSDKMAGSFVRIVNTAVTASLLWKIASVTATARSKNMRNGREKDEWTNTEQKKWLLIALCVFGVLNTIQLFFESFGKHGEVTKLPVENMAGNEGPYWWADGAQVWPGRTCRWWQWRDWRKCFSQEISQEWRDTPNTESNVRQ